MCHRLARLTPAQWHDAFAPAGTTTPWPRGSSARIQQKIAGGAGAAAAGAEGRTLVIARAWTSWSLCWRSRPGDCGRAAAGAPAADPGAADRRQSGALEPARAARVDADGAREPADCGRARRGAGLPAPAPRHAATERRRDPDADDPRGRRRDRDARRGCEPRARIRHRGRGEPRPVSREGRRSEGRWRDALDAVGRASPPASACTRSPPLARCSSSECCGSIESLEPERRKLFTLRVAAEAAQRAAPTPRAAAAATAHRIRAADDVGRRDLLRGAAADLARTDRLSNAIRRLAPGKPTAVEWDEKKSKG